MGSLKDKFKKATEFYNNINKISDDKEEKKNIIKQYLSPSVKEDPFIVELMENEEKFEIYHSKYSPIITPPIIIVDHELLTKHSQSDGSLYYFIDSKTSKMISPIIMISSRLFNYGNMTLLEYVISHEMGHFRYNHVSDGRNILDEVEADLYACESIGLETFMSGMISLIKYLQETGQYSKCDTNEVFNRLQFVANRKGVYF